MTQQDEIRLNRKLSQLIKHYIKTNETTVEKTAEDIDVCRATMYSYLIHSDKIPIKNLRRIVEVLKIPKQIIIRYI